MFRRRNLVIRHIATCYQRRDKSAERPGWHDDLLQNRNYIDPGDALPKGMWEWTACGDGRDTEEARRQRMGLSRTGEVLEWSVVVPRDDKISVCFFVDETIVTSQTGRDWHPAALEQEILLYVALVFYRLFTVLYCSREESEYLHICDCVCDFILRLLYFRDTVMLSYGVTIILTFNII